MDPLPWWEVGAIAGGVTVLVLLILVGVLVWAAARSDRFDSLR